jgi:hypothetical protein
LRVTAYVLSKKGLSIGMVNRKGFAAIMPPTSHRLRAKEAKSFPGKSYPLFRSPFGPCTEKT